MRTVADLFTGLAAPDVVTTHGSREISGVFDDSRRVQPGGLFVAVAGSSEDGRRFVADAVARGASVVVGEQLPDTGAALAIPVADARYALAQLAWRWRGLVGPAAPELKLAGVTGTNGKSTAAFMTRAILQAADVRCGLLGTLHYDTTARSVAAMLTTPGSLELAGYLRESADAGAKAVVMEVSSHALDQRRVDGLRLDAAAFTNLSRDHLDYHGTFEAYAAAKARLFAGLDKDAVAVVNADDEMSERMLRDCPARVVLYSLESEADLSARIVRDTIDGTAYSMRVAGEELALTNAVVGRHNVYNALAAAGLAMALGCALEAIDAGLGKLRNVPGRLQRVRGGSGPEIFVDYAHTPDALRNVLAVVRPLTRRRLIVVFGCGGDRDRGKRPEMAEAVARHADAVVVTSDNPRSEDPRRIVEDVLAGFDEKARRHVTVEVDRRCAIMSAIAVGKEGDVVLIAGKGHEDYQVIGDERRHFDDVEVALECLATLAGQEDHERGKDRRHEPR